MNTFRFFTILFAALLLAYTANAQAPEPTPEAKICISQASANRCAELARTDKLKDEKIAVLEAALLEKDKSVQDLRTANAANVADLTKRINELTASDAFKAGQLAAKDAELNRLTVILEALMKMVRPKTNGIKIF